MNGDPLRLCDNCGHPWSQHDDDGCTNELWDDGTWLLERCDCTEFHRRGVTDG